MKINIVPFFVALFATAIASSCAKIEATTDYDAERTHLEAWMSVNYPSIQKSARGIYILDDVPGTGAEVDDIILKDKYVFVQYTQYNLEGDITTTYFEDVAKRIGKYDRNNYYGPIPWSTSKDVINAGIRDMLKGMRVGGKRKALIPSWLSSYSDLSSEEKYLQEESTAATTIYEITLTDIATNITNWEVSSVEKYVKQNMHGVDSLRYGLYYNTLIPPVDTTSLAKDTTVYVNYVGRFLNGIVFDTNIADSAKVHNIYKESRDYSPMKVQLTSAEDEGKGGNNSSSKSTIEGFGYAISKMKPFEKGRTAFISNLGYGYAGSGKSIPSYSPLVFDIELVDKPDE